MNKILVIALMLLPAIGYSTDVTDVNLDGEWQFMIPNADSTITVPQAYMQWQPVQVPHTYNIMDGLEDYAGTACYSRDIPIDGIAPGSVVRLCFNGVYHDARVYVNGQKVGEHLNAGYTPFSFDNRVPQQRRRDGDRGSPAVDACPRVRGGAKRHQRQLQLQHPPCRLISGARVLASKPECHKSPNLSNYAR